MDESSERITRVTLDEARAMKDETDYARLDAMTDEDIARAVADDPDACPVDADWSNARLVIPPGLQDAMLQVDEDVVAWFQTGANDYRERMRAVLRAYAEGARQRAGNEAGKGRINHIALKVADLEAATRFYENVYGFRQLKTKKSRGHVSRHMTDGYIDVALMVYDSEDDPEAKLVAPGPAIHHFGIEVEDTAAFVAKIEANGGTILENKPGDAIKYRAPDGTISEIVEIGRYDLKKSERP